MKLTHENLQGVWIVEGSEIDHVKPGDEIYRFMPPDRFEMEFRQPNGRSFLSKQRYRLTESGFIYGREGNLHCAVTAWLESGYLVFRPEHGMETWSSRLGSQVQDAGESEGG